MIDILISTDANELRVAVVENDEVQDFYIENSNKASVIGNIYQGKIVRFMPGMQAFFVDIGLERNAFLPANEIYNPLDKPLNQILRIGQKVIVQVVKDSQIEKGAQVSTFLTLVTRYLVYTPYSPVIKFSRKIIDKSKIKAIRTWLDDNYLQHKKGGFIVRTAAADVDFEDLKRCIAHMFSWWNKLTTYEPYQNECLGIRFRDSQEPHLIHQEVDLPLQILRDVNNSNLRSVQIDEENCFQRISAFADNLMPDISNKVHRYVEEKSIFYMYRIDKDLAQALQAKVYLPSGGYIIIERTAAMTTIDVNTGSFVGNYSADGTVLKTNLEAVAVITRQLRLRNVGGIIIIDFIDMRDKQHRQQVMQLLAQKLALDSARTRLLPMSEIATVQITRERSKAGLEQSLFEDCTCCAGTGRVLNQKAIYHEILRELKELARTAKGIKSSLGFELNKKVKVAASEEVIKMFDFDKYFHDLEREFNLAVRFVVLPKNQQGEFQVGLDLWS